MIDNSIDVIFPTIHSVQEKVDDAKYNYQFGKFFIWINQSKKSFSVEIILNLTFVHESSHIFHLNLNLILIVYIHKYFSIKVGVVIFF